MSQLSTRRQFLLSRYEQISKQLQAEEEKTKQLSDKLKAKSRENEMSKLKNRKQMDPAKAEAFRMRDEIP